MSRQYYPEILTAQKAASSDFNSFTTAKTIIPAGNLVYFPQNYFEVGRVLRITVAGALSNIVTTPGTLTLQIMLGSVIAFTTGALQMSTTAHTKMPYWAQFLITTRTEGTSTTANAIGQAVIFSQAINATAVADGTQTHTVLMGPNTAPAVGTGWDSTASQTLDFFAGFSISNSGNLINTQQYIVEALN